MLDPACSTCYVNGNLPKGTQVAERTYPLLMEGQPIDHAKLVRELQSLPPEQAELKVSWQGVVGCFHRACCQLKLCALCIGAGRPGSGCRGQAPHH